MIFSPFSRAIRAWSSTRSAFCAVQRPSDHPERPPGYAPLDPFWRKRGYETLTPVQEAVLAEEFAGRNVTPISVALATDICFRDLNLHRVEICIRPENRASLRVVEKLGFRYEGYRRRYIHIDGDWRDHYCFALVAEEVPDGVLRRWIEGRAPRDAAAIPPSDRLPA